MAKPKNPTEQTLEGKTVFPIRCSFDLIVEVLPQASEFNGQITNQRRAEQFAETVVGNILRTIDWEKLSKKGIFRNTDDDNCDECTGRLRPECRVYDKHWLEYTDRCFKNMLFFGNGDYSGRDARVLTAKLEDAFSWLSGLQQGPDDERNGNLIIENVARDVVMALTGKEFTFVEEPKGEL